ncbi:MAG: methylenetetrahydrofolate dehydrogenase / methenyltetrahydrofolate cyclohydrolase, partial [Cryptosporangiaceae bacterium]|nr:methylenetetrahydrofolate dehydrogenase / methenyltetrahydrofolate cyclohydrolase [Cryptosporangiaceae bacterium]
MSATLMDGRAVAQRLLDTTAVRASEFVRARGRRPCLATVLVGDDPASRTYVGMKVNRCAAAGIESRRVDLGAATTTEQLVRVLGDLSRDDGVDGILLQHPVPSQVDERAAFEAITPGKDVDG